MQQKNNKPQGNSGQSIINNFYLTSDDKYGARQAKFYLKKLRAHTGLPEQRIICELILTGFDVTKNADISKWRDKIKAEWLAENSGNEQ